MGPDYFDVLPIHPPPQPLESLTSYLTRLAEANGIPTLYRLQPILFPGQNVYVIQEITDLPQRALGSLPTAAFCSEAALQATTVYELVKKFGRPLTPLGAAQFLGSNLASQLRYCPLCLQTDPPHYSLPWRFSLLTGCAEHGCRLLDRCSACGAPISFLPSPLKMNRCPHCGVALSAGRVEPLADPEYRQVQARYRDLVFLLSVPPKEIERGAIGPRLAYWRKARQRAVDAVAEQLKILRRTVLTLERRAPRRGMKFGTYLAYVDYLGLTFEELFNTVLTLEEEGYHQYLSPEQRFQQRETELLQQVHQAVDQIREQGAPLSQLRVSRVIDRPCSSLENYPRLRTALAEINQQGQQERQWRKQKREQELVGKVNQAIESLQAEGKPVTQMAIGRQVGMLPKGLFSYPQVKTILLQVADSSRQRIQQHNKQTLIANVQLSISELKAQGQPVTKRAVAKLIGVSRGILNYHPEVRILFTQCAEWTGLPPNRPRKGRRSR